MAVYAIGDLQGCLDAYLKLLDRLSLGGDDRIWLTGDLVNRGPQSLDTLRFVKNQGEQVVTVLGNHDLHLLGLASGRFAGKPNPTLQPILHADDRDDLLGWLRNRPLFHCDDDIGWAMAHAGIHPQWTIGLAAQLAREVEQALTGPDSNSFVRDMYGNHPSNWHRELAGIDRLRFIVNVFTRMRFCNADGRLDFLHKGPIGSQGEELIPWFDAEPEQARDHRIVFGHWSALGRGGNNGCHGIDTGCLWGNRLTALRLDSDDLDEICVECPQQKKMHG